MVNLPLVHTLLVATNEQPYGFLKLRGTGLIREVELMASAGLIEAAPFVDGEEASVVINRITDSGQAFLRAFKDQAPKAPSDEPIIRSLAGAKIS
jgi:hypothetical protein